MTRIVRLYTYTLARLTIPCIYIFITRQSVMLANVSDDHSKSGTLQRGCRVLFGAMRSAPLWSLVNNCSRETDKRTPARSITTSTSVKKIKSFRCGKRICYISKSRSFRTVHVMAQVELQAECTNVGPGICKQTAPQQYHHHDRCNVPAIMTLILQNKAALPLNFRGYTRLPPVDLVVCHESEQSLTPSINCGLVPRGCLCI